MSRDATPDPANQKVPDLLKRDFTAAQPNTTYVGDITYLPLATGANLYLATVIDCCSRRVTRWAIADHMRTELVADALKAAVALRGSLAGAVFHSDHGSQYTSRDFATLCRELDVTESMGGVGSSADNALAESFHATLKREVLQDRSSWDDAASCRGEVFRWLARYNTKRRPRRLTHESLLIRKPTAIDLSSCALPGVRQETVLCPGAGSDSCTRSAAVLVGRDL